MAFGLNKLIFQQNDTKAHYEALLMSLISRVSPRVCAFMEGLELLFK